MKKYDIVEKGKECFEYLDLSTMMQRYLTTLKISNILKIGRYILKLVTPRLFITLNSSVSFILNKFELDLSINNNRHKITLVLNNVDVYFIHSFI